MIYQCCCADIDPSSWTAVDAYDRELAAADYVGQLCRRDKALCARFASGELVVLIKVTGGVARAYEVTMEMIPHFRARPRL